jgi:hypothetical protein
MKYRFSTIHAMVATDTKVRAMVPGTVVDLDERFPGDATLEDLLGPTLAATFVTALPDRTLWQAPVDPTEDVEAAD